DFIQGLRPDVENNGGLSFKKEDGVFKVIADRAFSNIKESEKAPEEISQVKAFEDAIEILKDKIIETDEPNKINDNAYFTAVEDDAFRYSGDNWSLGDKGLNGFRMKYSDLIRFFDEGIRERKEIKKLDNISGLAKQHATYFIKAFELLKSLMPKTSIKVQRTEKKNYVIIIDEINRANISRVFGELITLIEEDKRTHGDIPMKATLPSGDTFTVPSNLFIIGTMNTADKSIALLDIALRRRFNFIGMYPDSNLINTSVKDQFEMLNKEIIASKGRDFQIGHSYFMGNDLILNETMNNKVIPLLMEYFMNDEVTVTDLLKSAGFSIEKDSWPLKIESVKEEDGN
ncbi:MAG: AAA family ATPase, partial [Candidatus Kapaibacterium sp.]